MVESDVAVVKLAPESTEPKGTQRLSFMFINAWCLAVGPSWLDWFSASG
jgi:hypothetical protein